MNHDPFDTLVAGYAIGALDGDDLVQLEAHLAGGCDRCQATLRESHEALARMASAEPRSIPPAHVKDALLRPSGGEPVRRAERARAPERRWVPWAAATAAVAVVSAMLTGGFVAARYEGKVGAMAREVSKAHEQLRRREAELATYRDAIKLLGDPATRVVELRGTGPNAEATGRVVWHERAGGHLIVAKLPPLPAGKAYEAWTLGGPTPRPAGVFTVDASGQASHKLGPTGDVPVKGFAVSVEPAAGVTEPTGPIVLASRE